MIGGKKTKTLKEARIYQRSHDGTRIYNTHNKVYKYYVGTPLQWLNL